MSGTPTPSVSQNSEVNSGDELTRLLLAEFEEQEEGHAPREEGGPKPCLEKPCAGEPARKRHKSDTTLPVLCPPHPGYLAGMCIRCGALKQGEDLHGGGSGSDSHVALKYIHKGLEVSKKESIRLRDATVQASLASRRLLLVLDLDHTLLHSTRMCDLTIEQTQKLEEIAASQPQEEPTLYRLQHMGLWTKLRPGLRAFLKSARELFDLHVFTMGDEEYAKGMATILDPDGKLFRGRVASATDAGSSGVKDVDILLAAEQLVLILDDTVGVWPRHRENLIQISRYIYFPSNMPPMLNNKESSRSLFDLKMDEDEDTGPLATVLRVMTRVHKLFFEEVERQGQNKEQLADVRTHLKALKAGILPGCCILFSRIIPKHHAEPSTHVVWQLAVSLGAKCVDTCCDEITHVVAGDETEKTRWGRSNGKCVVTIDWLWSSAFSWERADESQFLLNHSKQKGSSQPPLFCNKNNNEEDDVAFALTLAGGGRGVGNDIS